MWNSINDIFFKSVKCLKGTPWGLGSEKSIRIVRSTNNRNFLNLYLTYQLFVSSSTKQAKHLLSLKITEGVRASMN